MEISRSLIDLFILEINSLLFQITLFGHSYVALSSSRIGHITLDITEITIKMTIRTSEQQNNNDAVLLWQAFEGTDNFIGIGIKDGKIEFYFTSAISISTRESIIKPGTSK